MEETSDRGELIGKGLGLAVFLFGLGLLVAVFIWAYYLFNAGLPQVAPAGNPPIASEGIGTAALRLVLRMGFLFVMGYVASLITTKGIELYRAARGLTDTRHRGVTT